MAMTVAEIREVDTNIFIIKRFNRGFKTYHTTPSSCRRLKNLMAQHPKMFDGSVFYRK